MTDEERKKMVVVEIINGLKESEKISYLTLFFLECVSEDYLAKILGFGNWENYKKDLQLNAWKTDL